MLTMNKDFKKHKLLKILANQRNQATLSNGKNTNPGISIDHLIKKMNCDKEELLYIINEPLDNKEISRIEVEGHEGLYAERKGSTAFTNQKYKKRLWSYRKENVKFIFGFLASVIAIISLFKTL
jgi:hypothetical protein